MCNNKLYRIHHHFFFFLKFFFFFCSFCEILWIFISWLRDTCKRQQTKEVTTTTKKTMKMKQAKKNGNNEIYIRFSLVQWVFASESKREKKKKKTFRWNFNQFIARSTKFIHIFYTFLFVWWHSVELFLRFFFRFSVLCNMIKGYFIWSKLELQF